MVTRLPSFACLAALAAAAGGRAQEPAAAQLDRLWDPDLGSDEVAQSVEALARLGPRAGERLVERWLGVLRSQHAAAASEREAFALGSGLRARVEQVLLRLGPGAEPAVARLLDEVEKPAWATLGAVSVVVEVGPWHPALRARLEALAVPTVEQLRALALARATDDHIADAQHQLADALFRLQSRLAVDPRADVAALIDELAHDDPWRVELAAQILATRGAEARTAVAALVDVVRERPDATLRFEGGSSSIHLGVLRRAAADALWALARDDPRSVPALVYRLRSGDYPLAERRRAARRLEQLGPRAAEAVDDLIAYRNGWDDDVLMQDVCNAIGAIGAAARSALPMLDALAHEVTWNDALARAASAAAARIRGA